MEGRWQPLLTLAKSSPSLMTSSIYLFIYLLLLWTISIIFIDFVTILLLFYVLVFWPRDMWDLSSLTRDGTHTPCIGRRSLNHWTAREVP